MYILKIHEPQEAAQRNLSIREGLAASCSTRRAQVQRPTPVCGAGVGELKVQIVALAVGIVDCDIAAHIRAV